MESVRRRQQKAALGKSFEQWAEDFFGTGSPNLDVKLNQANVFADFQSETGNRTLGKAQFTQKLKTYCEYAGLGYNPRDVTGNEKDGERWRVHEGTKDYMSYMYIRSKNAPCANAPEESALPF